MEGYVYSVKNQLESVDDDIKEDIEGTLQDTLEWLEDNEDAEVDDFAEKRRELEEIVMPLMAQSQDDEDYEDVEDDDFGWSD